MARSRPILMHANGVGLAALRGRSRGPGSGRIAPRVRGLLLMALTGAFVAACGANVPTVRPTGSGGSATPSGVTLGASSATESALLPCRATAMKAAISGWNASAGSRYASVVVTSRTGVTCTVRGRPGVRLLDGKGKILLDSARIAGIGGPKVATGDPVVVLGPGDELTLDVQWSNWCIKQPTRPLTVALVLTDRGGLVTATRAKQAGDDDSPLCSAKSRPAQLQVTHAWLGPGI